MAKSTWRIAESLLKLRVQINAAYPKRSKKSDGGIGDVAHASRSSDHNPHVKDGKVGVVTAIDITHDPANGCDAGLIADALVESRDERIKYLIWNREMVSSYPSHGVPAWEWRGYTGRNPHDKHFHISVVASKSLYDDTSEWVIELPLNGDAPQPAVEAVSTKVTETTVAKTDSGSKVVEQVTTLAQNETVKTITSEGVGKLATKAVGSLGAGSTAAATSGAATNRTWLIVLAIVLAVLAAGVLVFWMWHKSKKERTVAELAAAKDKHDVQFTD